MDHCIEERSIRQLVEQKTIQLTLFDEIDLAEVTSPDYPGERLIVCRNPLLAEERARKRKVLLAVAEEILEKVVQSVSRARNPMRGKDKIGMRIGRELKNTKMQKHFEFTIGEDTFSYRSDAAKLKEQTRQTGNGYPVQSFQCLLKTLATLCTHHVRWKSEPTIEFQRLTLPTELQRKALSLLGLNEAA